MRVVRLAGAEITPAKLEELTTEQLSSLVTAASAIVHERMMSNGKHEEPDRIITVEEASAITGLSPYYIRTHKELPFVRQRVKYGPIQCVLSAVRTFVSDQSRTKRL